MHRRYSKKRVGDRDAFRWRDTVHIIEKPHQETKSTESISKESAGPKTEWFEKKTKSATAAQPEDKKRLIYEMTDTCTQLPGLNGGKIGDVARGLGGTLTAPPLNVSGIKRYFGGRVKQVSQLVELLRAVEDGVPAKLNNNKQTSRRRFFFPFLF